MKMMAKVTIVAVFAGAVSTSAFAAGKVHPVLVIQGESGGVLIGGTLDGKWLPAWRMAAKMSGGERYRLYSSKPVGTASGTKPQKSDLSEPFVKLTNRDALVAVAGNWNALPRVTKLDNPKKKEYLDAVHSVLVSKGIGKSPARIYSVVRVDLEGDGKDEAIISAQSPAYDMLAPRRGGYSFVMIRRVVAGKARTTVLSGQFNTGDVGKRHRYAMEYHAVYPCDIDGDGTMEVRVSMACQSLDASRIIFYDLAHGRVRELGHASHAN